MELTIDRFDLKSYNLDELQHGDSIFLPESDYGFGYINRINANYEFWEIPTYGGDPYLSKTFYVGNDGARECVKYVQSIC